VQTGLTSPATDGPVPPSTGARRRLIGVLAAVALGSGILLFFAVRAAPQSYATALFEASPVFYYTSPGENTRDITPGGNARPAVRGNYLVVPGGVLKFGTGQPFTIAAWVELPNRAVDQSIVGVRGRDGSGFWLYKRRDAHGSRLAVTVHGKRVGRLLGKPLPAKTRDYIVFEYDGDRTYNLYENGKLAASTTSGRRIRPSRHPRPLVIGARDITGADRAQGIVDDVAIWGDALSADEIAKLYATGR
jgi:hypothetical protein